MAKDQLMVLLRLILTLTKCFRSEPLEKESTGTFIDPGRKEVVSFLTFKLLVTESLEE